MRLQVHRPSYVVACILWILFVLIIERGRGLEVEVRLIVPIDAYILTGVVLLFSAKRPFPLVTIFWLPAAFSRRVAGWVER